jgi:glutathione S-transferase
MISAINSFYPTVSNYIINSNNILEDQLKNYVTAELHKLDSLIRATPGKYICGFDMTYVDLYIFPLLYNSMVGLQHLKDYKFFYDTAINPLYPSLHTYISRMFIEIKEYFKYPIFCSVDEIICNWKRQQQLNSMTSNSTHKIMSSESSSAEIDLDAK